MTALNVVGTAVLLTASIGSALYLGWRNAEKTLRALAIDQEAERNESL